MADDKLTSGGYKTWYAIKARYAMYGKRIISWLLLAILAVAVAYALHRKGAMPHISR